MKKDGLEPSFNGRKVLNHNQCIFAGSITPTTSSCHIILDNRTYPESFS